MKNRLFPIGIGLCFVLLIGIAFLHSPSPQTEAPVETESVQESVEQIENATRLSETDATSQGSLPNIDGIDMDAYKSALRSKDIEGMKKALGPETAARVDTAMKFMEEKMGGLEVGEFPDFNIQELMNIFSDEDGPKIDFEKIAQVAFREHFPEGEPEDYEAEMAARIHEIVAETPGDFHKVMATVALKLLREQDFQFWALANFKGEIGQQMKWMTDQILIGGELENIQYTVPEDMSTLLPAFMEGGTQTAATPTSTLSTEASTAPPLVRSDENGVAATDTAEADTQQSMSAERITAIREMLSQHGKEAAVLRLLETDKDTANWLLERFNSPTEIEEWLSKQATTGPRSKPTPPEIRPQPLPQEIQP